MREVRKAVEYRSGADSNVIGVYLSRLRKKEGKKMKTEINIKLTSGSVIEAHLSSSIEELDIIACLCESLEKCGAKVDEYNIVRNDDVSDRFRRHFRGVTN